MFKVPRIRDCECSSTDEKDRQVQGFDSTNGKAENIGGRKKEVENSQDAFYILTKCIKSKSLKIRKLHGRNKIKMSKSNIISFFAMKK